jgi:urease accessory protein UreF
LASEAELEQRRAAALAMRDQLRQEVERSPAAADVRRARTAIRQAVNRGATREELIPLVRAWRAAQDAATVDLRAAIVEANTARRELAELRRSQGRARALVAAARRGRG